MLAVTLLLVVAQAPWHTLAKSCGMLCPTVLRDTLLGCERVDDCACQTVVAENGTVCVDRGLQPSKKKRDTKQTFMQVAVPCVERQCDGVSRYCPTMPTYPVAAGSRCVPEGASNPCLAYICDGGGNCVQGGALHGAGCQCDSLTCASSECDLCEASLATTTAQANTLAPTPGPTAATTSMGTFIPVATTTTTRAPTPVSTTSPVATTTPRPATPVPPVPPAANGTTSTSRNLGSTTFSTLSTTTTTTNSSILTTTASTSRVANTTMSAVAVGSTTTTKVNATVSVTTKPGDTTTATTKIITSSSSSSTTTRSMLPGNGSTVINGTVDISTSDQSTVIDESTDNSNINVLPEMTLDGGGLEPWAIAVIVVALLLALLLVVGLVFFFLRRRDNDSDTSNNNNDEMQSAREQASIGATAAPSTDYQNLSLAPAPPLTTTSEYAAVAVPAATGTVGRHYARAPPTGVYTKAPAAREYDVAGPLAPDGYGVVPPYGTVSAAAGDTGYGAAPPSVTGAGVSAYAVVDPGATLSSPYEAASTRLDL